MTEKKPNAPLTMEQILEGDLLAKVRKKYGKGVLRTASSVGVDPVPRIPTKIFPLDLALGGGFPVGRVSIVDGHKSSAKTTLFLKTLASAQELCANCWRPLNPTAPVEEKCSCKKPRDPVCAYIDVEGALDLPWAKRLGVDLDRLILSVPEYAEQSLDIMDALVRSGDCDVVVLDSIAFLAPLAEIEESVAKASMGQQPLMIGKGIRKVVSGLNSVGSEFGRRPTVFLINQLRQKLGVMFGCPDVAPGGFAPGFAASVEVRVRAGKYEMDEVTGKPMNAEFKFKIEKNKCSGAKYEGAYKLVLSDTETRKMGQVIDEYVVVELAEKMGLLSETKDKQWECLGRTGRAKSVIEKMLVTDPAFSLELRATLMKLMLVV